MSVPIKDLLDLVVARGGSPATLLDALMARGGGLSVLREVEEWAVSKRAVLPPAPAAPAAAAARSALEALQEYEDEADVLRGGGGGAAAKKRAGRPAKKGAAAAVEELAAAPALPAPPAGEKKRRGRPPKSAGGTTATTSALAAAAAVVLDGEETESEEGAGGGAAAHSSSASSVAEEKKVRFKWAVFLKELGLCEGHVLRFHARDQEKKEYILSLPLVATEDGLALSYAGETGGPTPVAAAIKTAYGNFRPDAQHAKKGVIVPASGHKDWQMEHAGKWYRLADPIWNGLVWDAASGAFVARA